MKNLWMLTPALIGLWAQPARAEPTAEEPAVPDSRADQSGPPTLFGSGLHVGGYGGLGVMYSRIAGRDGALVGAEGGVLVDHRLALGAAGYAWSPEMRGPPDVDGTPRDLEVGYGGFMIRYSILTGGLVYGSLGAIVGGGVLALNRDEPDDDLDDAQPDADDGFFVFEPQLSLQVNLLPWMRVGLQGGYRITSGVGRLGYTEEDLNAVTLGGTLQFGRL